MRNFYKNLLTGLFASLLVTSGVLALPNIVLAEEPVSSSTTVAESVSSSTNTAESAASSQSASEVTGQDSPQDIEKSEVGLSSTEPVDTENQAENTAPASSTVEVLYRLYHADLKVHLYTRDANEYQVLAGRGWRQEGVAWQTITQQGDSVYRLYNPALRVHLYTKDANEYQVLAGRGWLQEGIAYNSYGEYPIYRLYHSGLQRHLYTTDANEYQVLAGRGWRQEGIAFYGVSRSSSSQVPTEPQPVKNLTISGQITFGTLDDIESRLMVHLTNVVASAEVKEVLFAIWSEANGQDDIKWESAQKQANGQWSTMLSLADHGYESGAYQIHVYAKGSDDKLVFVKGETRNITLKEPALTGTIQIRNNDTVNGRFEVVVSNVQDLNWIKEVRLAVWSDEKGQDDLLWYTASAVGDGTYKITIDHTDHHYSQGTYQIHLYYLQKNGHLRDVTASTATMTRTKPIDQKDQILRSAANLLGVTSGSPEHISMVNDYNSVQPLPVGYAVKQSDDWCDIFITVLFQREKMSYLIGRECGVERHIRIFQQLGIWNERGSDTPQVGDIITFNWDKNEQPNDDFADHIGIITKVENGTIHTIEGNSNGGAVRRKTYTIGHGNIRGFARPSYLK